MSSFVDYFFNSTAKSLVIYIIIVIFSDFSGFVVLAYCWYASAIHSLWERKPVRDVMGSKPYTQ